MTSALLFREGPDLDLLLEDIDSEHDGRARVVDISRVRDGGMFGFFARNNVNVTYTVDDEAEDSYDQAGGYASRSGVDYADLDRADVVDFSVADDAESDTIVMDRMHRQADRPGRGDLRSAGLASAPSSAGHETSYETGQEPAEDQSNLEFAKMLLEMASRKAAERGVHLPCATDTDDDSDGDPHAQADAFAHTPADLVAAQPENHVESRAQDYFEAAAQNYSGAPARDFFEPRVQAPAAVGSSARLPGAVSAASFARITHAEASATPVDRFASSRPAAPQPVTPRPAAAAGAHRARELVADPTPAPTFAAPRSSDQVSTDLVDQLLAIGVPRSWVPATGSSLGALIEQLVRALPIAVLPEPAPGQLIAIAGPADDALAEARRLCTRLGIDHNSIYDGSDLMNTTGAADTAGAGLPGRVAAGGVTVAVISTDPGDDPTGFDSLRYAGRVMRALEPDISVLVSDARTHGADLRLTASVLGRVDALALVRATRSARPAQTWESDLPIVSIDGRVATAGTWSGLLFDAAMRTEGTAAGVWS